MIRVTIDMVPGGIGTPRTMHVIEIFNEVTTTVRSSGTHGDYGYRISRKLTGSTPSWLKTGRVLNFNRKNRNAVQLLLEVMRDAYGKDRG